MITSSEVSGSMSVVVAGEPSESGVAHKGEQNDRQDALKRKEKFIILYDYIYIGSAHCISLIRGRSLSGSH